MKTLKQEHGAGSLTISRQTWSDGLYTKGDDEVVMETAAALTYNGISHVVMMITPTHLEDFALGFSLSEGIIDTTSQLLEREIIERDKGIEIKIEVAASCFHQLKQRRRNLEGRTGCGLCGAESLEQAIRPAPTVSNQFKLSASALDKAVAALRNAQPLAQATGASHAAAWCDQQGEILLVREDVGRHNAVDKIIGALSSVESGAPMSSKLTRNKGFIVVTSRASYEIVMKVAMANIGVLVALSAPTSMAIEYAKKSGVSLIGFAEKGRHSHYN